MKNTKLIIAILVAFAVGIVFTKIFLKKEVAAVEKSEEEPKEGGSEIELKAKSQELIGLKTSKVTLTKLKKIIPVIGQIAQDVENVNHITSSTSGIVKECKADIGSLVKEGDTICVLKTDESDFEIKSPVAGVVIGSFVKSGDKVDTVSSICTVADLSKLWANFDVYEKDVADVKVGQKVTVTSSAYSEKVFEGKIVFVSPRVDETSHTIKIRAVIENKEFFLKLGMFISGEIIFESNEEYLSVPTHAVQTMNNEKIIFIKTKDGKFVMKKINIKTETAEEVLMEASSVEGSEVKEGDEVVIEGAFLLKSELLKGELEEE
jgi:multidrug efflux pump subunit AcrA (membrane-fusion protein)